MELTSAVDELFRKIGRNLYIIQQTEMLLKTFLSHSSISFTLSSTEDPHKKQVERYALQTMGGLVSQYLSLIDPAQKEHLVDSRKDSSNFYEAQFFANIDQATFDRKKVTLTQMVVLRNELTHQLLDQVDLASLESCLALSQKLDEQREALVEEFNAFKAQSFDLLQTRKSAAGLLESDKLNDALKQIGLSSSLVVQRLVAFAAEEADQEGWVKLGKAANYLSKVVPEEVNNLKTRYGFSTLKALMLATDQFEFSEQATEKGTHVLYRLLTA